MEVMSHSLPSGKIEYMFGRLVVAWLKSGRFFMNWGRSTVPAICVRWAGYSRLRVEIRLLNRYISLRIRSIYGPTIYYGDSAKWVFMGRWISELPSIRCTQG
jgi:hypothetical protein